jgi:hypothetical protein
MTFTYIFICCLFSFLHIAFKYTFCFVWFTVATFAHRVSAAYSADGEPGSKPNLDWQSWNCKDPATQPYCCLKISNHIFDAKTLSLPT